MSEILGYCAAMLTTISFLPQVITVWRTRSARDISLPMYCLFTLGTALWFAYGIAIHSFPISLANAVTMSLAASVLVARLRFGGDGGR